MENQTHSETFSKSLEDLKLDYAQVHQKMDEFVSCLAETKPDSALIQELQLKFNEAVRSTVNNTSLEPYKPLKNKGLADDLDSDFGQLLIMNNLDKSAQRKVEVLQVIGMGIRIIIALLLILLGFGMIIMPAPPYFEMFTLFYLNPNDGVTIMDVISLIVAFIGLYILIRIFLKRKIPK